MWFSLTHVADEISTSFTYFLLIFDLYFQLEFRPMEQAGDARLP